MSANKARDFLEVILAHPDEDTPRLLYADWLDEEGDSARAEFVRVQIERARLPHWDARQVRLRLREQELLEQHGQEWKREVPRLKGVRWDEFRRGLIGAVTLDSFALLRTKAKACWAAAPIAAVSVPWPQTSDGQQKFAPIAGLRELSIIEKLGYGGECARLAEMPLLSKLHALNIRSCSLRGYGLQQLASSPHLRNLKALRVPFNSIGNGSASALFNAKSLSSLEELDLSETGSHGRYGEDPIMSAVGLNVLASWPGLARVRSLTLTGNDVGREGLRALMRSPHATKLKELVIRGNGLFGNAMQELGGARQEMQLDVLDLGHNLLRDAGVGDLASAPCLRELKVLRLDRCELRLSSARRLARAPFLDSLRQLDVSQNRFGPEGLRALLDRRPPALHTLHTADNDLGTEAAVYLAEPPASDRLLEVDLSRNGLGDHAADALAKSKHLQGLLVLRLNNGGITRKGAAALAQSPLGQRLAVLEVKNDTSL
jgi:uncharacterized protein (TIGR02996 family)